MLIGRFLLARKLAGIRRKAGLSIKQTSKSTKIAASIIFKNEIGLVDLPCNQLTTLLREYKASESAADYFCAFNREAVYFEIRENFFLKTFLRIFRLSQFKRFRK